MEQPRKAVVVTGFGPFGEHTVNASWIAVQELEKLGLGDSVDLHVYEIPVEYKTVQRLIPALWEKHSPQLVVHVGVSGMATTVTLEKCGHNKGYKGLDNCRFCPGSQCCVEDGPESIDSIIDMDAVCKRVTTLGLDVSVTISQDAGSSQILCVLHIEGKTLLQQKDSNLLKAQMMISCHDYVCLESRETNIRSGFVRKCVFLCVVCV
ncbi:pyroglutamyl-peptidase 1 isoform X2 [Rhinolophus ferrumequinum]|uniref:Pyroglutamyl-peptidase I n=1 Tax=Rhinolophus ferrumequinum TaxID=59479 RepID=A0A671FVY8_RHIFE|nr:pyroglutamyl-peptidase 1 isoform X2 [Rhinolophus ferrumequinum]